MVCIHVGLGNASTVRVCVCVGVQHWFGFQRCGFWADFGKIGADLTFVGADMGSTCSDLLLTWALFVYGICVAELGNAPTAKVVVYVWMLSVCM